MNDHPIQGLMETTMQKIREMIDVNTVVGNPIETGNGVVIIPVSKVSFGFASGGSDFPSKKADAELFGGGSGAGITIYPTAFLVVNGSDVRLLQLYTSASTADRIVNSAPELIDKVSSMFSKKKKEGDAPPVGE